MFFFLSKTLGIITNPLVIVGLVFVTAILVKKLKLKRALKIISLGLLIFFSNDFLSNEVMLWWEVAPVPFNNVKKTYTYAVVLTGVTSTDQMPDDRVYFQHGADRVVHAVQLYKMRKIKKVIISGGSGRILTEGRREADDIFKAMELMGVPAEEMVIENASRNTYESAINIKAMMKENLEQEFLLVTSAFHMRRSVACFEKEGFTVMPFSTDFYSHPRYFTPDSLIIPQTGAIQNWHKLFKEWVGIAMYWLTGHI
jgi:uncharacterized SAM-binding protein YcdF (DUF218 family)